MEDFGGNLRTQQGDKRPISPPSSPSSPLRTATARSSMRWNIQRWRSSSRSSRSNLKSWLDARASPCSPTSWLWRCWSQIDLTAVREGTMPPINLTIVAVADGGPVVLPQGLTLPSYSRSPTGRTMSVAAAVFAQFRMRVQAKSLASQSDVADVQPST